MNPATKATLLMLTGSILMLIGVFAKPLGIPDDYDFIPLLAASVFMWLGYRAMQKARAAGKIPAVTNTQKRKQLILTIIACAIMCSIMPFVLPYTGVHLPFGELVVICIISFIICIGAFMFGQKLRK